MSQGIGLDELRELSEAATPGPWRWHGQAGRYINLTTVGRGVVTVMGSKRLGMHGAEPTFGVFDDESNRQAWGRGGVLTGASKLAVREVPYRDDIVDIDHPNAQLIVAAVNYVRAALAAQENPTDAGDSL